MCVCVCDIHLRKFVYSTKKHRLPSGSTVTPHIHDISCGRAGQSGYKQSTWHIKTNPYVMLADVVSVVDGVRSGMLVVGGEASFIHCTDWPFARIHSVVTQSHSIILPHLLEVFWFVFLSPTRWTKLVLRRRAPLTLPPARFLWTSPKWAEAGTAVRGDSDRDSSLGVR